MSTNLAQCPHCENFNDLGGEPKVGVAYPCSRCDTSFQFFLINGMLMTANMGDKQEDIANSFAGFEQFMHREASIRDRGGLDLFDLINIGKNRGAKVVMESTPSGANWIKDLFMRAADESGFRQELDEATLRECDCEGCKAELERRAHLDPKHDESIVNAGAPLMADAACGYDDSVPSVPDIMADAAETFRERNALYGDSYKHFHEHMMTLFPNGLTLKTADEWRRFGILFYTIGKLVRYANNFTEGGHVDSAHDLGVYAFMLEEVSRIGFKEKGL